MLAVVKTPHIKIKIEGRISKKLINVLKEEYGSDVQLVPQEEDDKIDVDIKTIDAKKVEASYKDGVLEVSLPRAAEVKPKNIAVSAKKKEKASK